MFKSTNDLLWLHEMVFYIYIDPIFFGWKFCDHNMMTIAFYTYAYAILCRCAGCKHVERTHFHWVLPLTHLDGMCSMWTPRANTLSWSLFLEANMQRLSLKRIFLRQTHEANTQREHVKGICEANKRKECVKQMCERNFRKEHTKREYLKVIS